MALEYYLDRFQNLKMNNTGGKKSPHKVCMLLAVMDLIQAGHISTNKICLNQALKERFTHHFDNLAQGADKNTPENPFFHLRSEGFWHLCFNDGYDNTSTSRYSTKAVSHAYIDEELFSYMKSYIVSNELKDALVSNLSDLATLYHQWLIDIGKSEKTAKNYLGAIRGSISIWLMDVGELETPLTDINSYREFVGYEEKARKLEQFQIRDSRGKGMYSAALSHYHKFLADLSQVDVNADIKQVMTDNTLSETEKTILVNTRVGQGHFRSKLIQMWGGCAVTGYRNTQLLLASHIKPWRDSSNEERLDRFNGLLLLANLDKAFDLGFISFDDHGKVLISSYLESPDVIGLKEDMAFSIMPDHRPYPRYHRGELFKGR
ncbi:putative restriction endonuclease [Vibrio crassostreae]|uniref:HNH endonuclease n=1 Tax=Vibrio crassostreae TaxID=246167 RepID=UPI001048AEDF|nr:HNH endonuclease [Vibrio crassostreae]TCO04125.1 HNH endonuclease [Vibrio crassostreae]CAK2057529.1 putative restriction endonuclease [Vibrio crassostreae]CAK3000955.1 putative restriction endonuclease [Vibrio crassostreae]CAK3486216.1 putative restriction endonuclease [Vibrio crassostreae]CAK3518034.1 putative restriction endonuclease [Vibrio crassostreae]